jgi:hypothetical protein
LCREAAYAGDCAAQVLGQAIDDAFSPLRSAQLAADVFADLPVQTDEFGVDRLEGPVAGRLDEADDLCECFLWLAAAAREQVPTRFARSGSRF